MNNQKISKNKEVKIQTVARILEKVEKAKALVFLNYQGLTHQQLEELKKTLKESGARLAVTKNNLLKIALQQAKLIDQNLDEETNKKFDLPTAILYAYEDEITPLKAVAKMNKTTLLPKIKFGIFDRKIFSEEQIILLSALPPKQVLLAQAVGTMKSPLNGLRRALSWNMQKFVMTLKSIELKNSKS